MGRRDGIGKRMGHALVYAALMLVAYPAALLPRGLARGLGGALGLAAYALAGRRREIAVSNIGRALAAGGLGGVEPRALARENFRFMGRSAMEIARLHLGRGEEMARAVPVEGAEHVERARAEGRGILFVSGHAGNWELLVPVLSLRFGAATGVARRQSNPWVDRLIVRTRERYGNRVVYKEGALRELIRALKAGGMAGVVMDQAVMPEEGALVDFLGLPAWTTRMPSALARRTGAVVLPVFIHPAPDTRAGHVVRIEPRVELSEDDELNTRLMSGRVEAFIREHPAHWLWIHRRWKRAPGAGGPKTPGPLV